MLLGNQAKKIADSMVGASEKEPFVQALGDESGEGRMPFGEESGASPDLTDTDVGLDAATDKMMSALKSDDKAAFRAGLKSFIQLSGLSDDGDMEYPAGDE